ncbi:hypothetical protein [Streptomyces sp. ODS05-4]|uniref:hypothetical protein n=1 Tax=Streptomyces sp. ODS05-4 TaxID=2944939 RepID=UPI00210DE87D|nr:hypothetical protein [Streptomyces sp. ODS05-4]
MMPATLFSPLAVGSVQESADVFGCPSREPEPARVEVQVRAALTFFDLVGLLTYGVSNMTYAELLDDYLVRETVQIEVLIADLNTVECYSYRACRAYQDTDGVGVPREFVLAAGAAVTRVFGVSA